MQAARVDRARASHGTVRLFQGAISVIPRPIAIALSLLETLTSKRRARLFSPRSCLTAQLILANRKFCTWSEYATRIALRLTTFRFSMLEAHSLRSTNSTPSYISKWQCNIAPKLSRSSDRLPCPKRYTTVRAAAGESAGRQRQRGGGGC